MENWEVGNEGALEEGFSFEDSDHFEDMSLCSWMSEQENFSTNWRGWKRQNALILSNGNESEGQVKSLLELCSQSVAMHIPFEQVEKMHLPVPEEVQLKIAFWSFPSNEEDIRLYSCLANGSSDEFQRGEHYVRAKCVRNVLQIGFHLCGNVVPPPTSINKTSCSVAVTFDRCRITSCSCNCGLDAKWCAHVVALCLFRIQQPKSATLRAPVSESLSKLRRDQLQKFAQYLISELPQQILPTAQRLLDELLAHATEINILSGAPDPTAGPSMLDKSLWYLDETGLNENIKKTLGKFCGPTPIVYSDVNSLFLSSTEPPAAAEYSSLLRPLRGREPEGIWNLLSIVREMLKRRDSNAVLLLDIVTEQCLAFEQVAIWWYNTRTSSSYLQTGSGGYSSSHRPSNNISSEIAQYAAASMCDEIVALWRLVILEPSDSILIRRNELKTRLTHFHEKTLEIIKRGKYKDAHLLLFTGFLPAIDACSFDWPSTEITLCSHIVRKASEIKPSSTELAGITQDFNASNVDVRSDKKVLESPATGSSSSNKKRATSYCLPLSRKSIDPGSASDDSCIERDIEGVHLASISLEKLLKGSNHWEVAESSLDFTSDDASSAGSPVQFSMSSSDDVDSPTTVAIRGESSKVPSTLMKEDDITAISSTNGSLDTQSAKIDSPLNEDAKLAKYRNELDALFTRAESLHTHGRSKEACDLACKLAEEVLNHPEEFIVEPPSLRGNRKAWIRTSTSYACKSLERALFLCTVLSEHVKHHTLAFRVGLQGLGLKRLPASSKTLEVKLFYQQGELAALMKRLPLGSREVARLREKASYLAKTDSSQEFTHVLPLMLASFVFDAFCQTTPSGGRNSSAGPRKEISQADQDLGFEAAVNALSYKLNVSEAEHPLLCEGTRKQKGELSLQMLLLYRDQQHKLRTILENLLDKSLSPNLRASSAFPSSNISFKRSTSLHSNGGLGSSRSQNSPSDPPSSSIMTSNIRMMSNLHVDESTDEDDARMDRPSYNDSLPDPHGDVKSSTSCEDDYPSSSTVCSPPRRDLKLSWRSPTVRPKRKQHCLANVNSSASEEAMLSDTSPRLRRRNLAGTANDVNSLPVNVPASAASWAAQRYPSSPSSDSGSSSSNDSMGTSSGDSKRIFEPSRYPQNNRSPPRPNLNASGGLAGKSGFPFRKNRGRNSIAVPDIPNQPSEAAAHFFFELAKNVLVKAGGNSSTSLFMQQPQGNNQSGVNRNLVLAAFEIGLYALGLHNCVSPNWLSRTYSSHVSWITGQAMEIGSAALAILVDSWEGHLTPPETASLADRASRGRDSTTVRRAAEVALSVLPRAHALSLNEIQRALLQCREQGVAMLEKACYAVEQAGRGGGVFPEVLVDVARQWEWIHHEVNEAGDHDAVRINPPAVTAAVSPAPVPNPAPVATVSQPTGPHSVASPSIPVSVSGMVLPGGVITIQNPRMPIQCHPGGPIFHGFGPAIIDHQLPGVTPAIPPVHPYAAVHLHPAPAINLLPMPPSNLHALQYHPAPGPFLPDPHVSALHHQNPAPIQPIQPINMQAAPISQQLQNAFRVGMLALDMLTKRTEDRPNMKYARTPSYANDVKWILDLSIKLGLAFVQQFCMAAVGGVSSPFILQDIAVETAKFLSSTNNQPPCSNLRASFLAPVVSKCLQMYIQFIHHRLYHIHHNSSDYDEFVSLVQTARNAFYMTPNGILQFNEVLQTINRSKSCKKELWHKINAGLHI